MRPETFDRLAATLSRRGVIAGMALLVAGARGRAAGAQEAATALPGQACARHAACVQIADAPVIVCLSNNVAATDVCCSPNHGVCSSDWECCGAGLCLGGACEGGPGWEGWTTHGEVPLRSEPREDAPVLVVIPDWVGLGALGEQPRNGHVTASWQGEVGWAPTDRMTMTYPADYHRPPPFLPTEPTDGSGPAA